MEWENVGAWIRVEDVWGKGLYLAITNLVLAGETSWGILTMQRFIF